MPDNQPNPPRLEPDSPSTRPRQRIQGSAANGLVTVTVSPTGELLGVHVHPGDYQPQSPPGLANMGDMVVEALRDAKARAFAVTEAVSGSDGSQHG
jgi:DNA-binding protein YbaB